MENIKEDALQNIEEVRANAVEKKQLEEFKKEIEENFNNNTKA